MKILFYGACHVTALVNILNRFGPPSLNIDRIHNFELMQSKSPFPYDCLGAYDFVVFSPIFSRGEWNTEHLVQACRAKGVRTIAFPLIEWRGYFPGLVRHGDTDAIRYYPGLISLALQYDTYADFESFIVDGHIVDDAEKQVARATTILRRAEAFGEVDIRVSDMLERGFRNRRMMLTPTHPTRALYSEIVRELELILGLRVDPSFHFGRFEPQEEAKDPLLPATIRALDLAFSDCEYCSRPLFGDSVARSLRTWLWLYYAEARQAVIFEARSDTYLKRKAAMADTLPPQDRVRINRGETIVAFESGLAPDGSQKISVFSGPPAVDGDWFLYKPAWRRHAFSSQVSRSGATA